MADREFPRYAVEAAIRIRHGEVSIDGRTKNVSRGGLCANTTTAMEIGASIIVEMSLIFDEETTSEPLELPGRVAWSTPLDEEHQVGISFRGLTVEQTKYLDLFLRYLASPRHMAESNHDDLFRG